MGGSFEQILEEISSTRKVGIEEAPIVGLVNMVLRQAVQKKASDIHFEPSGEKLRVRLRIDGFMTEISSSPFHLHSPIVSRIKVMSDMDIAESRLPQDGRFDFNFEGRTIDVRVSSFPAMHGEAVVLRLLDKQSMLFSLEELGLSQENLKKFEEIITKPYGIVLVTGPTGSGKTTTLYATLNRINSPKQNIITIEDPIEYELTGIRQSHINPKAGLVFSNALRSVLRQDPDVILVGEIRDIDTAKISIEAALTGHLVFSTLHTNDAPGALTRLVDMGVESFLVSSSTVAVIAQRLVRKICPECKAEIQIPDEFKVFFDSLKIKKIYKGKGCRACGGTGFSGRSGMFELLAINDEIRDLVNDKAPSSAIKRAAIKAGMTTLRDDGLLKVAEGITSLDEVLRVTQLD
jgi:type II secretory ATPase GspE/PulE/Tfp pilus assembly ATPase PilB-like protein